MKGDDMRRTAVLIVIALALLAIPPTAVMAAEIPEYEPMPPPSISFDDEFSATMEKVIGHARDPTVAVRSTMTFETIEETAYADPGWAATADSRISATITHDAAAVQKTAGEQAYISAKRFNKNAPARAAPDGSSQGPRMALRWA